MSDIKFVIAKNIYELRVAKGMTQLELAEELHYSDKAVSKWEKGDSLPEITTLIAIAEIFGVTLDYFTKEHKEEKIHTENKIVKKIKVKNRALISTISVLLVWLIATFTYFLLDVFIKSWAIASLPFLYAIPISFVVWLIFNSMWFNQHRNFLIISLLMWVGLGTIFITFFVFGINIPKIFLLGIPAQIIIALWSGLKKISKKN
ncbi:MAG: helix-turn-helix transcriptional regulator [Ruminococcaceae bacterium]|nr:helix-turn-helix transcriptional regulator [Oscillospiraceae bacterium]